eukprot:TRINITY_DN1799_c0_g1_i2.p1 TRINITY_DN1799_c0_g1~~TRINITY_DN1799_c0_g1_i2.p1  ORF type:complete len:853 (+),score=86.25 TRINITY_DN1799_c0_g1_i2:5175-7733(+)
MEGTHSNVLSFFIEKSCNFHQVILTKHVKEKVVSDLKISSRLDVMQTPGYEKQKRLENQIKLNQMKHNAQTKNKSKKSLAEAVRTLNSHDVQVTSKKMVLNYQKITNIWSDSYPIPSQYSTVSKLYLGHNFLEILYGLEFFKQLTHLSLTHNQIMDIQELSHVKSKKTLEHFSIQGNFMCKHPNYRLLILRRFPHLKTLNDFSVNPYVKSIIKYNDEVELKVIPFAYNSLEELKRLESLHRILKIHKENPRLDSKIDPELFQSLASQYEAIVENAPSDFAKIKGIRDLEKIMTILKAVVDTNVENLDGAPKAELQKIYKGLFRELLVGLKMRNNRDMEKYLCFEILKNREDIASLLKEKVRNSNKESLWSESQVIEECIEVLIKGVEGIDYEEIQEEMLNHFYLLSPNPSRIDEPDIRESKSEVTYKEISEVYDQMLYRFPVCPLNEDYVQVLGDTLAGIVKELIEKYYEIKLSMDQLFPKLLMASNRSVPIEENVPELNTPSNENTDLLELSNSESDSLPGKDMPKPAAEETQSPLGLSQKLRKNDSANRLLFALEKILPRFSKENAKQAIRHIRKRINQEKSSVTKLYKVLNSRIKSTLRDAFKPIIRYVKTLNKKGRELLKHTTKKLKEKSWNSLKNLIALKNVLEARADIRHNFKLLSKFFKGIRLTTLKNRECKMQIGIIKSRIHESILRKYFTVWQIIHKTKAEMNANQNVKYQRVTFDETINKATAAETYMNITNQDNTLLQVLNQKESIVYEGPSVDRSALVRKPTKPPISKKKAAATKKPKRPNSKQVLICIQNSYSVYNKKKMPAYMGKANYRSATLSFVAKMQSQLHFHQITHIICKYHNV